MTIYKISDADYKRTILRFSVWSLAAICCNEIYTEYIQ
jgi:hypothetical protein